MKRTRRLGATAVLAAIAITAPLTCAATASGAVTGNAGGGKRALLISVDGLHNFDLAQWISGHPSSNLAKLSSAGTTHSNAADVVPTDSFPGVLSFLTGGTSKSNGVYYDDAYARDLWAPGTTACTPATQGTEAVYDESIDTVDAAGFK